MKKSALKNQKKLKKRIKKSLKETKQGKIVRPFNNTKELFKSLSS